MCAISAFVKTLKVRVILSVIILCTWQDGPVPYDDTEKLSWKSNDRTKDFSIRSLIQEGLRGINQLDLEKLCRLKIGLSQDAEEVNLLLKEIKCKFVERDHWKRKDH